LQSETSKKYETCLKNKQKQKKERNSSGEMAQVVEYFFANQEQALCSNPGLQHTHKKIKNYE
jgi:hypothetical protein